MDNPTLIRILKQTPEARLKILELAEELTSPAWKPGKEQPQELEQAVSEAENHIAATQRLHRAMRRIVVHPGG